MLARLFAGLKARSSARSQIWFRGKACASTQSLVTRSLRRTVLRCGQRILNLFLKRGLWLGAIHENPVNEKSWRAVYSCLPAILRVLVNLHLVPSAGDARIKLLLIEFQRLGLILQPVLIQLAIGEEQIVILPEFSLFACATRCFRRPLCQRVNRRQRHVAK